MLNESVKQANMLTEEELYEVEIKFLKMKRDGDLYKNEFEMFNSLLASHRTLNSRNANLVHENDELMAENEMMRNLVSLANNLIPSENITWANNLKTLLEELNHE